MAAKKTATLRLDPDLWIRYKRVLLGNGTTMQKSLESYVRRYVETYEGKEKEQ